MNKTKLVLASSVFVCFLGIIISCDKKVGKLESSVVTTPVAANFCDTITYTKHIAPIIALNCALSGCHNSGSSNGDYTSYSGVLVKVNNGSFKNRVFNAANPMPASGLLPQKQLDIIKCWLDKGALNN